MPFLICEEVPEFQVIKEGAEGEPKKMYIEGIFLMGDIKNRNGRIYPKQVLHNEVARYTKEFIEGNRAYGELGHPQGPVVNPDRISHRIISLKEDGSNYIGKALIHSTTHGNTVKTIINEGGQFAVSSRGMGSIKKTSEGINEVQADFQLSTAADIVIDPSAPSAFVNGIMECRGWVFENGVWQAEQFAESTRKEFLKSTTRHITEHSIQKFAHFLDLLSKK